MGCSFIEKLQQELQANGMFESQAQAVVESLKIGEAESAMASIWNRQVDGYPPTIWNIFWRTACVYALKYIDAHAPKAWFRPVFLPADEQETFLQQLKQEKPESI